MKLLEGYEKGWGDDTGDTLQRLSTHVQQMVTVLRRQRAHHCAGPERPDMRLDGILAGCLEFLLRYNLHTIEVTPPAREDTPEQLRDKALVLCLYKDYQELDATVKQIAADVYSMVRRDVIRVGGPDHPMLRVLEKLVLHQEMHIRRLKRGATDSRTKRDAQPDKTVLNSTDGTELGSQLDGQNRWIIFNPLQSDYSEDAIDEVAGGIDHMIAIQVDRLNGTEKTPEPFGAVVSRRWCELLQFLHNALHFCEYATVMLQSGFDDSDVERYAQMPWAQVWSDLMGAYSQVSISKYGRGRDGPTIVACMALLRDNLRALVKFRDRFFNSSNT